MCILLWIIETILDDLEIVITEIMPEESFKFPQCESELKCFKVFPHVLLEIRECMEHILIDDLELRWCISWEIPLHHEFDKCPDIPELCDKLPSTHNLLFIKDGIFPE